MQKQLKMRLPIFREIFKIWKYPPVLIRWQNDFFSNLFIQKCIRNNFSSISRIFSHNRGTLVFGSVLGVFSMKIWKWDCRFETKKSKNETTLKHLQSENDASIENLHQNDLQDSANTERIVFSPRASFSRHPQYIPAPSVYRYRRVYQAFRGTLNRAWPPVSVSIPSCSHADVPRLVTRNSDKNQKNFLLHKHISLKSASTHQEQSTLISVKITIFSNSTCAKDLEEPENDILSEIYLFRVF